MYWLLDLGFVLLCVSTEKYTIWFCYGSTVSLCGEKHSNDLAYENSEADKL